jgi:hypothetical protein
MNFLPITQKIKILVLPILTAGMVLAHTVPAPAYTVKANQVRLNTANFDGVLSATEDDVQAAMEIIDEIILGGGSGDVTAAAAFGTDNVLIRSDGTGKGVQSTGISIADTTNDITGAGNLGGTGATLSGLTASEILATDASKNLQSLTVATYPSLTELTYVKGVTSAIQTQLGNKQAADADLTTYAGITPAANVQSILGAADYAAIRTLLDLESGTDFYSIAAADLAFQPIDADLTYLAGFTPTANVKSILNAADYAAIKALLDLEIGTDVQAYDADLTTYAGITPAANVQSILGAADYAAIRTLLDLESGTDFYSIAAADLAYQPLDTELSLIAGLAETTGNVIIGVAGAWASVAQPIIDLTNATNTPATVPGADHIDALTEIAQGIKTAADDTSKIVVGTAGATDVITKWDSTGAAVSSGVIFGTMTDGKLCGYTTVGTVIDCNNDPSALGADAVGTAELDDDANTPVAGYAVVVETGGASFDYVDLSAVYQPLEATLTDIADGTIAENLVNTANPWADNEVADDITASSYLPLAGGVLTGEVTVDNLGLEFTAGDDHADCTAFSATGGGIFFDDSEGIFKKCQDNTLSDLDTGGAETNSLEADGAVGIADTEIFIGTGAGTGNYAAMSGEATMANTGAVTLADSVTVTGWTMGTFSATQMTTTGNIELGHATDTTIARTAAGRINVEGKDVCLDDGTDCPADSVGATIIPLAPYSGKLTGAFVTATITGVDAAVSSAIDAGDGNWRALFDATTDQAAVYWGIIPNNYSSTPLCKIPYSMSSATTGTVEFECAIMCITPGDAADVGTASFATAGTATETVPGTAGHSSLLSITPTDDSCAAEDIIYVYISTDADDVTNDTATGNRESIGSYIKYTGS